jgi:glycosyltransferase involved in cell wall biosynthesis
LTDPTSELARVIDEERIGWHVPPSQPDELTTAIHRIYEQRSDLTQMGTRARAAAIAKYSLHKAIDEYRKALS